MYTLNNIRFRCPEILTCHISVWTYISRSPSNSYIHVYHISVSFKHIFSAFNIALRSSTITQVNQPHWIWESSSFSTKYLIFRLLLTDKSQTGNRTIHHRQTNLKINLGESFLNGNVSFSNHYLWRPLYILIMVVWFLKILSNIFCSESKNSSIAVKYSA